ncbi:MAG: hypothetical protein HQK53_14960, partial [Oligoflexia bacterium]|nr:hypothetical protein [Oligoflexia bacterium]
MIFKMDLFLKVVILFCFSVNLWCKENVNVYTYHDKPPYYISEKGKGIYFSYTELLNKKQNDYKFLVKFLPRIRINTLLEKNGLDGIIIGVNPIWFKDKDKTKYYWTNGFLKDEDVVVSSITRPFEYTGPDSAKGKIWGTVRGLYYFGLEELSQKKEITKEETATELQNLEKLNFNRIDFTVMSRSTLDYYERIKHWRKNFAISKVPHDIFERHVLIPKNKQKLYEFMKPLT